MHLDAARALNEGNGLRKEGALEHDEIVGIAGTRLPNAPAVLWAGQPHVHGSLAYPAPTGCKGAIYSLASGVLPRMQASDGVILAVRRQAALSVGLDAQTFDGFHLYDLDFTYRAHLRGLRDPREAVLFHEAFNGMGVLA